MRFSFCLACSIVAAGFLQGPASAQHEHHAGMHHQLAAGVKLEVKDDVAAQTLTVRVGPINLPAHSDHHALAQPPDLFLIIPVDGWLTAYHPRMIDDAGHPVPKHVLHHVAFWNTVRSDFLCPNKPEHIFGAGGEMNDWSALPGYGYRVRKGDRIRISTMVHNPSDTSFPKAYLEVNVEYRRLSQNGPKLNNVYPAWFDVQRCGSSGYDLTPGKSTKTGDFNVAYTGTLLGVGGHLHDYGRQLVLENETRKEQIAVLDANLDGQGRVLSIPIANFLDRGGYTLNRGEVVKVTATYDNTTGKELPEGAMGIVVGYFLPANDRAMAGLAKRQGAQEPSR